MLDTASTFALGPSHREGEKTNRQEKDSKENQYHKC